MNRQFVYLLPEIIVLSTALVILVADMFLRDDHKDKLAFVSVAGMWLAAASAATLFGQRVTIMSDMFVVDSFSIVMKMIVLIAGGLAVLVGYDYLRRPLAKQGEWYFLMTASVLGMMIMTGTSHLLVAFLAIQLTSIPLYILTGFKKGNLKSSEAALKYFLLGIITAAITLYGMSLIYGLTGSLHLPVIAANLAKVDPKNAVLFMGMVLIISGFSFKIAAVPFHFWAPDVYEGAPTPVAGFIAAVPKVAGFAVLARLVYTAFPDFNVQWMGLFALLAVLTMTTGNLLALPQKNFKRMLAFSGIAHVGYMLIALAVGTRNGLGALVFYAAAYAIMNVGAFAIVVALGRTNQEHQVKTFAGLGTRSPLTAAAMTLFLLSMMGFPLTAGFSGKLFLFSAAVQQGFTWLVVIGVVNSVISVFYYLRVVREMYFEKSHTDKPFNMPVVLIIVVAAAVLLTLALGFYPEPLIHLTRGLSLLHTRF